MIKCDFCGFQFTKQQGQARCGACFSWACRQKLYCPNCNFQVVQPLAAPKWVKKILKQRSTP